jgi:sterol desaturase/sphingolipid hydroxylase (fatty acid hydroxylase superfamily)
MPEASLAQVALTILAADALRYLLAAGAVWLLVFVVLRRRLAGRRILGAQVAPGQMRREITCSLATVLIFAANGTMIWLLARAGTLRLYFDATQHGWAWWCASLVLIVLAHDAWFYWTHRLLHRARWFRAVHFRHHQSRHPTPWAAYAFHPAEALLQAAFLPLWLWLVPTHATVVGVFLLHMIVRNAIGHCAHELVPRRWAALPGLRWVTPVDHHHYHHARNRGNFGLYFGWWDRLCGTEDPAWREARALSAPAARGVAA